MTLTAEEVQLACIATPESWRLPPEKDDRDKQIDELNAQVVRLSRSAPQLTVEATSDGKTLTVPLVVRRTDFPPLSPAVAEELTTVLEERYPMKTDFSREADNRIAMEEATQFANQRTIAGLAANYLAGSLGPQEWQPPSDSSVRGYHEAYAKWVSELRRYLSDLHTALPGRSGQKLLSFSLENSGLMPADHVLVEIEALGGLLLARRPKKDAPPTPALVLPPMPEAPGWKAVMSGSFGSALQAMQGALGGTNRFA